MTWLHRKYRRFQISQPFYCMRKDVVSSYELQKVPDITSFLLLAERWRGIQGNTEGSRFLLLAERWRGLPGTTEGSRYHILFIACGKMTWSPRKSRRFQISHPFYCVRKDDVTFQEVQKVHDVTSFLLLAGRWHGLPGSTEDAIYHILSFACEKMTWYPRKYRRFEISHPFWCVREDDVTS
jgi:hypothetical protein